MSDPRWIIGIDIGGTNLVVGLVPFAGGKPHGLRSLPTGAGRGGAAVVERIVTMVRESVCAVMSETGDSPTSVAGVGIGSPGPLNRAQGVVLETPNLGWRDFHLRELLSDALSLPATLDNDANCATLGEWWQGAGRGVRTLLGVTVGTGIGGGLVHEGRLYRGVSDVAGEIGHMTINFAGRRCKCGNYGCLEAYASGPNIAARAREGIESGEASIILELLDGDLDSITAATVYQAVKAGDDYATGVLTETAKILGAGVAGLINVLNPEAVVITGGVTAAGEHLFAPLRAEVRRRAFAAAADACRIVPAELPGCAGVIGAAGVFKQDRFGSL